MKVLCKKNFMYETKNDYSGFIPIKVNCFIKGELYEYIKEEKTISVKISGNKYVRFMIDNDQGTVLLIIFTQNKRLGNLN